ncbi:MAG: LysR family transcriptional regulator, partial [Mycobacteriaceae bacterium]
MRDSNQELIILKRFVAVAEELHFARAAKALNISRQTLSQTIITLEEELATKLFIPGASPTQLTPEGQRFLETSRSYLAEAEELRKQQAAATAPITTFTIGFPPGVTLAKWTRVWEQRLPEVLLNFVHTTIGNQTQVLHDHQVNASFVRLPVNQEESNSPALHIIPLYSEVPVVVVPKDHPISLFSAITRAELSEENLLNDPENTLELDGISDAIELVAAGIGIVIVPQSIARFHHRKDLIYRPVTDLQQTHVGLAWLTETTGDHIEEFIGIVRGRTAQSSRTPRSIPAT